MPNEKHWTDVALEKLDEAEELFRASKQDDNLVVYNRLFQLANLAYIAAKGPNVYSR